MCMPTPPVTKSAMRSRSATQRATWSRVSGCIGESIVVEEGLTAPPPELRLLSSVDSALELRLVHLRAARDVHPLRLVVELLLGAALRAIRAGALSAAPARGHVAAGGA